MGGEVNLLIMAWLICLTFTVTVLVYGKKKPKFKPEDIQVGRIKNGPTYGDAFRNGIVASRSQEQLIMDSSIVNWNRCVERAAQIAEEAYKATDDIGLEKFQKCRKKHGAYIASKIRLLETTREKEEARSNA